VALSSPPLSSFGKAPGLPSSGKSATGGEGASARASGGHGTKAPAWASRRGLRPDRGRHPELFQLISASLDPSGYQGGVLLGGDVFFTAEDAQPRHALYAFQRFREFRDQISTLL
jgi:hypothetical protein